MAGETIWVDGTELLIEASGASMSNDAFAPCNDDDRQPADSVGFPFARFEFDTETTGFSVAPAAGATISIYEQTINSDGTDSPEPDANNEAGFIGYIQIDVADVQQFWVSAPLPINVTGGKYFLKWSDGGSGVASVDAGWEVRMIPTSQKAAA